MQISGLTSADDELTLLLAVGGDAVGDVQVVPHDSEPVDGDAHAKNFSVLRTGGEWRVAPAYDVPSSYPCGDTTMALTVNGGGRLVELRRAVEYRRARLAG